MYTYVIILDLMSILSNISTVDKMLWCTNLSFWKWWTSVNLRWNSRTTWGPVSDSYDPYAMIDGDPYIDDKYELNPPLWEVRFWVGECSGESKWGWFWCWCICWNLYRKRSCGNSSFACSLAMSLLIPLTSRVIVLPNRSSSSSSWAGWDAGTGRWFKWALIFLPRLRLFSCFSPSWSIVFMSTKGQTKLKQWHCSHSTSNLPVYTFNCCFNLEKLKATVER